jgi:hypothetical protein
MKITIGDKKYRVYWNHKAVYEDNPITTCQIYQVDDFSSKFDPSTATNITHEGRGVATCSVHDHFSKKIGRKLSFGRALINLTNDKNERTRFWDEYLLSEGFTKNDVTPIE